MKKRKLAEMLDEAATKLLAEENALSAEVRDQEIVARALKWKEVAAKFLKEKK